MTDIQKNINSKFSFQDIFFFFLLIVLAVGFYSALQPFVLDIFLAIVFVNMFNKPNNYFIKLVKGKKRVAAGLTLVLAIVIVLIPISIIGIMVSAEAADNYVLLKNQWPEIQAQFSNPTLQENLSKMPLIGEYIPNFDFAQFNDNISEALQSAFTIILSLFQKTFVNLTYLLIHFFIIMFLMYYLIIDGAELKKRIFYLSPLKDEDEDELFGEIKNVIDAIVFNTFIVGIIEGSYGALLFYFTGIPSPFFWGILMIALSMIPLVGANTIILPATIIMFLSGNVTEGIILLIFGVGGVLFNQNIIKPKLDSKKSGLHPAIVFLSSMGGIMWLGIIGFLIGPLIAALFITVLNQYGKKFKAQLSGWN